MTLPKVSRRGKTACALATRFERFWGWFVFKMPVVGAIGIEPMTSAMSRSA
jgi:hypothetical protein